MSDHGNYFDMVAKRERAIRGKHKSLAEKIMAEGLGERVQVLNVEHADTIGSACSVCGAFTPTGEPFWHEPRCKGADA